MKVLALIIPLLVASVSAAQPDKESFEKALAENPEDRDALYNLGLAHYLEEEYPQAIEQWERLAKLEPGDAFLAAKLIQAYWAASRVEDADRAIRELRAARASGENKKLAEEKFFIRDQFVVGEIRAFTLEYFELAGERPLLWKFILKSPDKEIDHHYSVGSYDFTTDFMRGKGELGPDERAFHLDGYWTNGNHETFRFFRDQPDYAAVRAMVIEIMKGDRKSISSTVVGEDGTEIEIIEPE